MDRITPATDGLANSEIGKMEEYGLFEYVVILACAPVALTTVFYLFAGVLELIEAIFRPVASIGSAVKGDERQVDGDGWI